jgi:HEAT repeat protein
LPIAWLLLALLLSACADEAPVAPPEPRAVIRVRPAAFGAPGAELPARPGPRMRSEPAAMAPAGEAALASPDAAERERAVLDFDGDLAALAPLASGDASAEVRRAAVQRLAEGERPIELAALRRALDDPDPGVLVEAILALSALGDPKAKPALARLRAHSDAEVRALAEDALASLQPD